MPERGWRLRARGDVGALGVVALWTMLLLLLSALVPAPAGTAAPESGLTAPLSATIPTAAAPSAVLPAASLPPPPPSWNEVCVTGAFTGRCMPQPPSSVSGQLVYDARDGYGLFFGGSFVNQSGFHASTWKYLGAIGPEGTGTWVNITSTAGAPPNAEDNGSLVYAPSYDGGTVLLIGGYNA